MKNWNLGERPPKDARSCFVTIKDGDGSRFACGWHDDERGWIITSVMPKQHPRYRITEFDGVKVLRWVDANSI